MDEIRGCGMRHSGDCPYDGKDLGFIPEGSVIPHGQIGTKENYPELFEVLDAGSD